MNPEQFAIEAGNPGRPEQFALYVAAMRAGARLLMLQKQMENPGMVVTDREGIDGAARMLRGAILAHEHPWDHSPPPAWLTKANWLEVFHEAAKDTPGLY